MNWILDVALIAGSFIITTLVIRAKKRRRAEAAHHYAEESLMFWSGVATAYDREMRQWSAGLFAEDILPVRVGQSLLREAMKNLEVDQEAQHYVRRMFLDHDAAEVDDSVIWPLLRIAQNTPKCSSCGKHMAPAGGTLGAGGFDQFACWDCDVVARRPR